MTFGTHLDNGGFMKKFIFLWMAGSFFLISSSQVFSQVSKTSRGSWSAFADYHHLRNKAVKPSPSDKKPKSNKKKSQ